jgi:hypothetical protein
MIKDVNGWTHRSSLGPSTTFAGDVATLTGRIDLAAIRTLLGRLERTTGVLRDSYEIQVVADVRTQVTAGGETEQVSFAPGLSFRMDALEVQPMPAGTAPDAGATLHPTGRGQLETAAARPASLSVLGRNVNVRLARIGAVAGGVSSVAVLLLGIVLLHRRRGEDELTWILRRYGRMLAPVSGPMERANREIHVADMETLVWLAEHHDRLILYARTARGHDFAMEYGGVCYRYDVGSPIPAPTIGTNGHARIDSNGSSARRPAAAP